MEEKVHSNAGQRRFIILVSLLAAWIQSRRVQLKYHYIGKIVLTVTLFVPAPLAAQGQISVTPSPLYANGDGLELSVYASFISEGAIARWNGSERVLEPIQTDMYKVLLLPGDVAASGIGELEIIEPWWHRTLGKVSIPIYYDVRVKDAVYDPVRKRLFLTTANVKGDPQFPPNALVALDVESGAVGPVQVNGDSPGSLSLSTDGASLFVSMDGPGLIRRVNPDSLEIVSEFRFRPDASGGYQSSYWPALLAVSPLDPSTVAVWWHPDPAVSSVRLAIFDHGQQRPKAADYWGAPMMFAPDGQSLFMGDYATFSSGLVASRVALDATGIPDQKPVSFRGGAPLTFLGDVLYTSAGVLVDIRTNEVVALLGAGIHLAVDPDRARVLAIDLSVNASTQTRSIYLQAFDMNTQEPLGRLELGQLPYYVDGTSAPFRVFRFGDDGLVATNPFGLMLLHTPLAGPAPEIGEGSIQDLGGTPLSSVKPGQVVAITGAHLGPKAEQRLDARTRGRIDPSLGGVQVWFGRIQGTVVMASESHVEVVVPAGLPLARQVPVQLWNTGIPSGRVLVIATDGLGVAAHGMGGAQ